MTNENFLQVAQLSLKNPDEYWQIELQQIKKEEQQKILEKIEKKTANRMLNKAPIARKTGLYLAPPTSTTGCNQYDATGELSRAQLAARLGSVALP